MSNPATRRIKRATCSRFLNERRRRLLICAFADSFMITDDDRYGKTIRFHPRHHRGGSAHGEIQANHHAFSARAEWLSAHRSREIDLPQLWDRARVRRRL